MQNVFDAAFIVGEKRVYELSLNLAHDLMAVFKRVGRATLEHLPIMFEYL